MTVNTKELAGIPVRTRSGRRLGRVASFDLEAETGRLQALRVKTRGLVPGLLADELLVSWDAVVELTPEEVIVMDGAVPAGSEALARSPTVSAPSLMKEG